MADWRRPLGLALSAGGALGSWQIGALHALERAGLSFDSVMGFSAGALAAAVYALGLTEEALRRWEKVDGGILSPRPRLWPPALFSDRSLWEAVDYAADEEAARARTRCRLTVASARADRSGRVYARFSPPGQGPWDAPLAAHIVASCSIPLIFPSVTLAYRDERLRLFDGGVPCREPLSFRCLEDCRDVLVLEVVRPEERAGRGPPFFRAWWDKAFSPFDRRMRELVRRLMDEGVRSLQGLPQPPRIFRLAPSRPLAYTALSFRRSDILASLELGARDAQAFLREPHPLF